MPLKEIKQFVEWSMNGEGTLPQRLDMMKQQEASVLKQIQDTEQHLKKIQEKIARYERDMTTK